MDDRHARHRRADADRRRRPSDGHRTFTRARFDRLVADAVVSLPPRLRDHLDHIDLTVEDVPTTDQGTPLSQYHVARDAGAVDRLTLYRRPLELRAASRPDLIDLVRATLVRQLVDRLGLDDESDDGW